VSYVTNAVLSARYMDRRTREQLERAGWRDVGRHAGGTKLFEADTFAKAYNHTNQEQIHAEIAECIENASGCALVIHEESDTEVDDDLVHIWFVSAWGQPVVFHPAAARGERTDG
jgi:hypothetical protein